MKKLRQAILYCLVIAIMTGCSTDRQPPVEEITGNPELDEIIGIALAGDTESLREKMGYTTAACTTVDGLGGPPKCVEGETEGTPVEVFPFLGPEGHFIRKSDIDAWTGVPATRLYAVYQVSETAYSESYAPAGDYALVFLTDQPFHMTLRVTDGQIVRIDNSFGEAPIIRTDDVARFLVSPDGS